MDGLQSKFLKASEDTKRLINDARLSLSEASSAAASPPPPPPPNVLIARPPRQVVSLWTCSKLCAVSFAVGIIVGYTLKRRVKRWASKILKRLKDD